MMFEFFSKRQSVVRVSGLDLGICYGLGLAVMGWAWLLRVVTGCGLGWAGYSACCGLTRLAEDGRQCLMLPAKAVLDKNEWNWDSEPRTSDKLHNKGGSGPLDQAERL
uniref:Uncharacterized protein n=1 Tax=Helianthus annuus TaxID=4232 RepID=A0A251TLK6_HELAN